MVVDGAAAVVALVVVSFDGVSTVVIDVLTDAEKSQIQCLNHKKQNKTMVLSELNYQKTKYLIRKVISDEHEHKNIIAVIMSLHPTICTLNCHKCIT